MTDYQLEEALDTIEARFVSEAPTKKQAEENIVVMRNWIDKVEQSEKDNTVTAHPTFWDGVIDA